MYRVANVWRCEAAGRLSTVQQSVPLFRLPSRQRQIVETKPSSSVYPQIHITSEPEGRLHLRTPKNNTMSVSEAKSQGFTVTPPLCHARGVALSKVAGVPIVSCRSCVPPSVSWSLGDMTRSRRRDNGRFPNRSTVIPNPVSRFYDFWSAQPFGKRVGDPLAFRGDALVRRFGGAETRRPSPVIVLDLERPATSTASQLSNPDRLME